MKIQFAQKNYDIGVRLQKLITEKIEKLKRYFPEGFDVKIVCKEENKKFKLEVSIFAGGAIFHSEAFGENMFENIDVALPKIERQIIKKKTKMQDKRQKQASVKPQEGFAFIKTKPRFKEVSIVREKTFNLTPLTPDEALFELEALDHDFFIFINKETGSTAVVYRRKSGQFGIINTTK